VFGASSGLTHGSTFRVSAWVSWVSRTHIWVTRWVSRVHPARGVEEEPILNGGEHDLSQEKASHPVLSLQISTRKRG
jgi:hypothetical protein